MLNNIQNLKRKNEGESVTSDIVTLTVNQKPDEPTYVQSLESWLVVDEETGNYTITPTEGTTYYVSFTADAAAMNGKVDSVVTADNSVSLTGYTENTAATSGTLADG